MHIQLPWHADRISETIIPENVEEIGCCPTGSSDTKCCQCCIPNWHYSTKFIFRSVLHIVLPTKYQYHIYSTKVEAICPIFDHPNSCILMLEFLFEVEHIWVIGQRNFHVIHCAVLTCIKINVKGNICKQYLSYHRQTISQNAPQFVSDVSLNSRTQ